MADLYFFDTDCLSSFLLTNNENILFEIFKDNICLPSQVLNEANKYKNSDDINYLFSIGEAISFVCMEFEEIIKEFDKHND